jgi:hypothetical protein
MQALDCQVRIGVGTGRTGRVIEVEFDCRIPGNGPIRGDLRRRFVKSGRHLTPPVTGDTASPAQLAQSSLSAAQQLAN